MIMCKCTLNRCLEWNKYTNFVHDKQWFNTLIPPSNESAAVYFVCRIFGNVDFTLDWTRDVIPRYTSTLYHARNPL